MVDWDGLENRCGCKLTVGSNPTLSATYALLGPSNMPENALKTATFGHELVRLYPL